MSAVQECLRLTEDLLVILRNENTWEREQLINKIDESLLRRENLMSHIQPPFSGEDKMAGMKLLELNKELSFLLERIHSNILRELNELELKKTSASRYADSYRSASRIDGAFYDKRL